MFREQRLQGERRMQQGIYEREKERKKEGIEGRKDMHCKA